MNGLGPNVIEWLETLGFQIVIYLIMRIEGTTHRMLQKDFLFSSFGEFVNSELMKLTDCKEVS